MNVRSIIIGAISLALVLLPVIAPAGEVGTVLKSDDIRAEPFRDAKKVGSVAAGEKVEIIKREGGWLNISAPKKGWIRMLSIKRGAGPAASAKPSGVLAAASGRAGTGQVVSTSGIRGLNEEALKAARFDEKELKTMESYGTARRDADKFAAKAKLKARPVDYLPE